MEGDNVSRGWSGFDVERIDVRNEGWIFLLRKEKSSWLLKQKASEISNLNF